MVDSYNVKEVEEKIKRFWESEKIYKFDPKKKGEVYSIDTPPPYASSGHLHVGHALHYTQFEIIARIMRMLGYNVYFAPGFDDNGLPTEKYVEEKLGINKAKTNRADFRRLCLKESKKVEREYSEKVFKRLGYSYDWDLLYTTISPEAQRVAQTSFVRLVKKKDCYRKEEPTIWCSYHETALAQAEVEDLERTTKLNYINFDIKGQDKKVSIATTRPEFLPACVGIFVHPNDKRYKNLIGKELIVPLFNYSVKVMKDEKVDMNFGTGIVMTCTFGDNADIEWWKKYNLELRNLLNENGTLKEIAGKYKGLSIEKAKEAILKDLEKQGRLLKQEFLQQIVGSCWRCNNPVEYIVTKQWFVKTLSYKKDLIKRAREIRWFPEFMRNRFENWTENLGWDWIISRQRFYGVPIPVWYCDSCNEVIIADEKELPIDPIEKEKKCPKCKNKATPEKDVFDTWMTSSNSPEIALRWLEKPGQYKKLAPMSLRPQSHDIIRTWAFYTILKSHLLFNRIPWKDVMIGTFVLDSKGKGMHKSKGNAVWADELIEKYNVDAFRYWVGTASIGGDLPFNEQELVAGKKLMTKLWNASQFVAMNLKDYDFGELNSNLKIGDAKAFNSPSSPNSPLKSKGFDDYKKSKLEAIDGWMLEKTKEMVEKAIKQYKDYDISNAKKTIENFFWHDFCDNYLEIVKKRIYENKHGKKSAQYVLYESLLSVLKMIAPIMPFITEEIYQEHFRMREKEKSIHLTRFPEIKAEGKTNAGDLFIEILSKVRQEKTKAQKSMKSEIILSLDKETMKKLKDLTGDLKDVCCAKEIREGKEFSVEFV